MDAELSEITLEEGNSRTAIIFRGSTYSIPLHVTSDKSELSPEKYDEVTNSNSIQDANIYVETNSRGPCRLFCVPVRDCLGETELVRADLSQVSGEILTSSSESIGEIDQPLSGSIFTVSSSELSQSELPVKTVELNASSVPLLQTELPVKRKGGWPKGKKRKKEAEGIKPPKAPLTGYVIFLNRQRQLYKERHPELPFAEVTKLLGNEWSHMQIQEKQKYLDEAEADKKRYREELKAYQQTDAYKEYLKRKQIKSHCNNKSGSSQSDLDSQLISDDLDDDGSEELYCKVCNQFFNSLHNKKEHLYGKHHLQAITGEFQKEVQETNKSSSEEDSLTASDLGTDLLISFPQGMNEAKCKCKVHKDKLDKPVNVSESMQELMEIILVRESEISQLQVYLEQAREKKELLTKNVIQLEEIQARMQQELKDLKTYEMTLNTQLESLRMVPTLFGVINF